MNPAQFFQELRAFVGDAVKKAKPPAQYAKVLREVHQRASDTVESIIKGKSIRLACKAGCSFCCHLKVDAQAHEVLYAADYIRLRLSTEVEKIIFRSRAHLNRIKPMSLEEQLSTNNQCPLLVDGRCSIYDVRPISCRKHHATNVRLCEDSFNNGDPNLPGSENEELKMFGSVLWMGVKMGFRDAGYDSETYDFGSAIGEALANPVAARRWRDKKRAFSIEVRAKDSEMASSLDNMIDSAD